MTRFSTIAFATLFLFTFLFAKADPINCDLSAYRPQPGLLAEATRDALVVRWTGEDNQQLRLEFTISNGVPTIRRLSVMPAGGRWRILAAHMTPVFRVTSGVRRVTQQQTAPLAALDVPLTADKLNEIKWDAFWDAPLYLDTAPPRTHKSSIPQAEAFANHPGMPRKPDEVVRGRAHFDSHRCMVRTRGTRLEIVFPGATAGIFAGYLQFDIYKMSNLIRQMLVAKTSHPSAAFKYDAGLAAEKTGEPTRFFWRDLDNNLHIQQNQEAVRSDTFSIAKNRHRVIAAGMDNGSIAAFPPPHSFYWARETEQNLGYGWYQADGKHRFAFGIRQAELEEDPEFFHNFALYSARPDTWQRMPVFFYVSGKPAAEAINSALRYTRGDHFKPLPGYKVMGHHYHVGLLERLNKTTALAGTLINDVATMKGIGVDIYGVVDGVRGPGRHDRGEAFLEGLRQYYEAAKQQSDTAFLVMPNDENSTSGRPPNLGGHYDILPSKPVYWVPQRHPGQPLAEHHPVYGKVYHIGTPDDLMEMSARENMLISLPHPRSKGSTGYPEAIKDKPHFLHPNYFALGYRWGMGIDASEERLGEYRFLTLWDEVNNWMAARNLPPKYALAISEARSDYGDKGKPAHFDVYGMSPVNYVQIERTPGIEDMSALINALKSARFFVTSGEVLIPFFEIRGQGERRTLVAEVEWTFPLAFVEVVWGDGEKTGRQVIPTDDFSQFGQKRFEIPFDVGSKKWVRFAAWDVATNGALVQPVSLMHTNK